MLIRSVDKPTNQFGENQRRAKTQAENKKKKNTTIENDPESDRENNNKTLDFPFSELSLIQIDNHSS